MSKRRGRGEGSIYQRNGRWYAQISLPPLNGRRRRKTVSAATKSAVLALLRQLKPERDARSDCTVAEYLRWWLAEVVQPARAPGTHYISRIYVEGVLIPWLGAIPLSELSGRTIERFYREISREKRPGAVAHIHRCLSSALRTAVKTGRLSESPLASVTPPRPPQPRHPRILTPEEVRQLLAAAGKWRPLIALAITTGMRLGEILALDWPDIDLSGSLVRVRATLNQIGTASRKAPKTANAIREIPIPPWVSELLAQWRGDRISGPVFPAKRGGYLTLGRFYARCWRPLIAQVGIPDLHFHDLRHSHASLLLDSGESPRVVQERLGHASIQITLGIYGRLQPGAQRRAADRISHIVLGNGSAKAAPIDKIPGKNRAD